MNVRLIVEIDSGIDKEGASFRRGSEFFKRNVNITRSVHGSYTRFMDRGPYSDATDTRPMERPK